MTVLCIVTAAWWGELQLYRPNALQNWPYLLTYLIAYRDSRNCRLQSIFLITLYTTTGISSRVPSFQLFPRWLKVGVHNIPTVHLQFSFFKLHVSATLWRPLRHVVAPRVAALTWRRRDPECILRTQVTFLYIRAYACVRRARRQLQVVTRIQQVCSAVLLCA